MHRRKNRAAKVFLAAAWLTAACVIAQAPAQAQTPAPIGDSAKAILGPWEFSNADRDKRCTAEFKTDRTPVGYRVEFDSNCATLFPFVAQIAGWVFPDNDLLRLLDANGRVLAEFSEVEDGIYEAPTPGVGVLFLQNAASAGPPPKPIDTMTGDWGIVRADGNVICTLVLSTAPVRDALTLAVKPGCEANIARLGFAQWRLDRGELLIQPARGNGWRFEELDTTTWRRIPDSADPVMLVRQ